jgi:site-specific recombinase XerD
MHRMAGYEPPTSSEAIKAVVAGIRRSLGTAVTRKAPATAETVRAIISDLPADLRGLRDRALLLLGFAGALRRSELVALNVDDVEEPLRVCTSISGDQRRIRKVPVISSPFLMVIVYVLLQRSRSGSRRLELRRALSSAQSRKAAQ